MFADVKSSESHFLECFASSLFAYAWGLTSSTTVVSFIDSLSLNSYYSSFVIIWLSCVHTLCTQSCPFFNKLFPLPIKNNFHVTSQWLLFRGFTIARTSLNAHVSKFLGFGDYELGPWPHPSVTPQNEAFCTHLCIFDIVWPKFDQGQTLVKHPDNYAKNEFQVVKTSSLFFFFHDILFNLHSIFVIDHSF